MTKEFKGKCWTTVPDPDPGDQHRPMAEKYDLNVVLGDTLKNGLAGDPERVTYGGNSGYQAIHLAYNWGASRIILLGYDFGGTKSHWFGEHPQPIQGGHDYPRWLKDITFLAHDLAAKGVEVINCSRETAIHCFTRKPIAEINTD